MRATKELTVAIVIKPLHMPLQAGVPDPAPPSSLSRSPEFDYRLITG